jgi:AraC-like DNA-binding protein
MGHLSLTTTPWDLVEVKNVTDRNELEKRNFNEFSEKLNSHLLSNKFYLDPEMSVAKLSDQLGCPEYKLRNHINQTLGFKNFNDFLNYHRVKDACAILENPAKADISIYNLGMDLGFGSPVSFNRAFKKFTGKTPTEYKSRS